MAEQLKPKPAIDLTKWGQVLKSYDMAMSEIEEEREKLSARAKEARGALEAEGINIAAANAARAYVKCSDKKKDAFDLSYRTAREAVGEPIQLSLLDAEPAGGDQPSGRAPMGAGEKAKAASSSI